MCDWACLLQAMTVAAAVVAAAVTAEVAAATQVAAAVLALAMRPAVVLAAAVLVLEVVLAAASVATRAHIASVLRVSCDSLGKPAAQTQLPVAPLKCASCGIGCSIRPGEILSSVQQLCAV